MSGPVFKSPPQLYRWALKIETQFKSLLRQKRPLSGDFTGRHYNISMQFVTRNWAYTHHCGLKYHFRKQGNAPLTKIHRIRSPGCTRACTIQTSYLYKYYCGACMHCMEKKSQLMRLWYLSHRRPTKAQVSLRIRAVSPEPSLFAHMKYGS